MINRYPFGGRPSEVDELAQLMASARRHGVSEHLPTLQTLFADGRLDTDSVSDRPDWQRGIDNGVRNWSLAQGGPDPASGGFHTVAYSDKRSGLPPVADEATVRGKFTTTPVPGYGAANIADKPKEGDGAFGTRRSSGPGHTGYDIKAPEGTPVVAAGDGVVWKLDINPSESYGTQVAIDHGDGVCSVSAHLSKSLVKPGQTVKAGDIIGYVGRTGNTPKPRYGDAHNHFEVRLGPNCLPRKSGGRVADPAKFVPGLLGRR